MSLVPFRQDMYAPSRGKHFGATTAAVLHVSTQLGGDAPTGINHLPCGVVSDTAGVMSWKDVNGDTITTTLAAGIFVPIAPAELVAGATPALTVFWVPEP